MPIEDDQRWDDEDVNERLSSKLGWWVVPVIMLFGLIGLAVGIVALLGN
jgi:hypothetical protein